MTAAQPGEQQFKFRNEIPAEDSKRSSEDLTIGTSPATDSFPPNGILQNHHGLYSTSPQDKLSEKKPGFYETGESISNRSSLEPNPITHISNYTTINRLSSQLERSRLSKKHRLIFALLAGFIFAVLIAVAHMLFFIHLDQRKVSDTISQNATSIISVGLVRLYGLVMTLTLTTALVQLVWRYFRQNPATVETVDSLYRLCVHFLTLSLPHAVRNTPAIALIAVCIAGIPIAMVFPPSALTVQLRPVIGSQVIDVPVFDLGKPDFFGTNKTVWNTLITSRYWNGQVPSSGLVDQYGTWTPTDAVEILTNELEIVGGTLSSPSPCGQNCSYIITIQTPGYSCSNVNHTNLYDIVWPICSAQGMPITHQQFLESDVAYISDEAYDTATIDGVEQDIVRFEIHYGWRPGPENKKYLSCILYENITTAELVYRDGTLSYANMLSSRGHPLKASLFRNNLTTAHAYQKIIIDLEPQSPQALAITNQEWNSLQIMGLHQGFITSLSGMIVAIGEATLGCGYWVNNPLLPPADASVPGSPFHISEQIVQQLIFNMSIAWMNTYPNNHTSVRAQTNELADSYIFRSGTGGQQWHLYGPYLATLVVGLIILSAGLWALNENGVSAQLGFAQVLVTTAASDDRLRQEAVNCSRGGYGGFSRELLNLRVRFVDVPSDEHAAGDGYGVGMAGFESGGFEHGVIAGGIGGGSATHGLGHAHAHTNPTASNNRRGLEVGRWANELPEERRKKKESRGEDREERMAFRTVEV